MDELLAELNAEQRAAVVHQGGPLLVLAGPGSGKTRVIAHRLAYRIRSGTQPARLLAVTFTNRAADEMKSRVSRLVGEENQVPIGTFHWMCNALLRRHIHHLGYSPGFRLLSPREAREVMRQSTGLQTGIQGPRPGDLSRAISAMKNGASESEAAQRFRIAPEVLADVRARYDSTLRKAGVLDLDDLLVLTVKLLSEFPQVRERCRAAHEELLVDEYQDVNAVQYQLVRLLEPIDRSVVVVGDEDQAIYGWRQADLRSVIRFSENFPGAATIKLEESYRCTKRILRAAGNVVAHNRARIGKRLRTQNPAGHRPVCFVAADEVEEAEWIASEIKRLTADGGHRIAHCAVLYRVNAQSRAIEDALVRNGVPYHVYSGQRFYDRPEVQRVIAYLRLLVDPRDEDAATLLFGALPGMGMARLERFREFAGREGRSLLDVAMDSSRIPGMPGRVRERMREVGSRVYALSAVRYASLPEAVNAAVEMVSAETDIPVGPDWETIAENLQEFRTVVRELNDPRMTLRDLLDRIASGMDANRTSGGVSLMTLHAAKGLEFDVVFIAGVEEGLLPHRRALSSEADIEEERRLCYVGMTRARRLMHMSYAHARLLGGQASIGQPSRFIEEAGRDEISLQTSSRVHERPRLHRVHRGERVLHPRWGPGTVAAVEGSGRDTLVSIAFDNVGTQRLQLCHAPLARVKGTTDVLAG